MWFPNRRLEKNLTDARRILLPYWCFLWCGDPQTGRALRPHTPHSCLTWMCAGYLQPHAWPCNSRSHYVDYIEEKKDFKRENIMLVLLPYSGLHAVRPDVISWQIQVKESFGLSILVSREKKSTVP